MRRTITAAAGVLAYVALITGCGNGTDNAGGTPSVPATSTTTSSAATSSAAGQVRLDGVIGFPRLTCVAFRAKDGTQYALTGSGVTPDIRARARGGHGMQTSLNDPAPPPGQQTDVRVWGRPAPGARSTCGLPVLVTTQVELLLHTP